MSLQTALDKITAQQPKERTHVWMVGEQLKDMLRAEPHLADIVAQDLDVKEMSLSECERKIAAFARSHNGCVIPSEAERIIREFYGLPARGEPEEPVGDNLIRLEDFFS